MSDQDLGYCNRDPTTGSSFGITDPFPLLSSAACKRIQTGLCIGKDTNFSPSSTLARDLLSWFASDRFENLINRVIDVRKPPSPTLLFCVFTIA